MSTPTSGDPAIGQLASGEWRLDPARSSIEFSVPNFWGLARVKGRFHRYDGSLDLSRQPAVVLTIEADSLDTGNARRDKHLRSADFFDVERHPEVRFESDSAALEGDALKVRGQLHAAGKNIPLELDATLGAADGGLHIQAETPASHRDLGMTWNLMGSVGASTQLMVTGPLVRSTPGAPAS